MPVNEKRLSELLSAIYPDYPEKISGQDRAKTDWELCNNGVFSEGELLQAYSLASGVPIAEESEFKHLKITGEIPEEYSVTWNIIAGRRNAGVVLLAVEPYNLDRHIYMMRKLFNVMPECYLVRHNLLDSIRNAKSGNEDEEPAENKSDDREMEEILRSMAGEARTVRLVNDIFMAALEQRASDIHIEPVGDQTVIRFRVDGILRDYMSLPLSSHAAVVSRIKLLGNLNIAESRLPQDGRTNIQVARNNIDIRISTMPTLTG